MFRAFIDSCSSSHVTGTSPRFSVLGPLAAVRPFLISNTYCFSARVCNCAKGSMGWWDGWSGDDVGRGLVVAFNLVSGQSTLVFIYFGFLFIIMLLLPPWPGRVRVDFMQNPYSIWQLNICANIKYWLQIRALDLDHWPLLELRCGFRFGLGSGFGFGRVLLLLH